MMKIVSFLSPARKHLLPTLAILLGCEAPMIGVRGRVTAEDGQSLRRLPVEFIQFDRRDAVLGRDTALISSEGTYARYVIRAQGATRLRFSVSAPGYQTSVVDVPLTNETGHLVRDFVLHR